MIARLRGEVIENLGVSVVVECGGVGYEAFVPASVAFLCTVGHSADLWVRHIVREDDQTLYGFASNGQRRVFDLLREVKGCGPKTCLAVLSELNDDGAVAAIMNQDTKALTRVSGIGLRLAERIIVELRDKAAPLALGSAAVVVPIPRREPVADELVDALLTLGYRRTEAESAAETARTEAETVAEQLKAALRRLAR